MILEDQPAQQTEEAPEAARTVECPLCGYDQEGALASFRAAPSCPLRGRCPECGLDWFWGDLLHPARQLPNWFAENPKRWAVPVLFGTWRRALRPRRFWRQVLVTLPIHRARLAMFAATALLLAYLAAGAASMWMAYLWTGSVVLIGGRWVTQSGLDMLALAALCPIDSGDVYGRARPFGPSAVLALMWFVLMPLPFLLLRDTFMLVRVRRIHLLRIWAYSLAAWPAIVLACAGLKLAAAVIQRNLPWGPMGSVPRMWWDITNFTLRADWLIVLLSGLWLGWFWSRAIRQYLRLPNARAVVVLMMIASFLAALAIAAYYPGSKFLLQIGTWMV